MSLSLSTRSERDWASSKPGVLVYVGAFSAVRHPWNPQDFLVNARTADEGSLAIEAANNLVTFKGMQCCG